MNTQQTEIDALKAQVKTLKRMFYGFGCLVVAGIALAATSMQGPTSGNFTDLTCTSLTVNDGAIKITKAGQMTTKLYSDSGGDGQVELYNSAGHMCAELYGDSNGDGRLRLYMEDGTEVVDLYASSVGGYLDINNEDGTEVAVLTATPYGSQLVINNTDGNFVAYLASYFEGGGFLRINDKDGNIVFTES